MPYKRHLKISKLPFLDHSTLTLHCTKLKYCIIDVTFCDPDLACNSLLLLLLAVPESLDPEQPRGLEQSRQPGVLDGHLAAVHEVDDEAEVGVADPAAAGGVAIQLTFWTWGGFWGHFFAELLSIMITTRFLDSIVVNN